MKKTKKPLRRSCLSSMRSLNKPGEAEIFFASKLEKGKDNIYKCETSG